ncbi:MAG TPA: TonB-dependent receptor [Bryobacteraceae bacterium]|jgi:hypothetical protein
MRSFFTTLCLLLCAAAAFAQSDRGIITGTVTDTSGAVVANAAIEAKQLETGAVFPTTSTATGSYTLSELPVGSYEISATVSGFKKYVRSGINVQVAQTLRIDIPLQVGAASESVTVSADASLLKTESGDVSANVQVDTLDTLPMLGTGSANAGSSGIRNPNGVLAVVPGAYYVPNSQVKINGAQSNSYAFHVEGQDSTNAGFPYAAAQTQPSVDAIQEVSVQTSNFAAEYGAVGGGFFNVTMKSGTNQFHGSVYDYFVNEILNAGTPFTNAGLTDSTKDGNLIRPRARRNDYGFTVGGPVEIPKLYHGRDKTFFFFNFEQFRETQIINNTPITVPTNAYRTGDFSGVIAADGNKQIGTDVQGNPLFAGEIFDPSTRHTVNVNGTNYVVENPFTNNAIPLSQQDPVALKVQSLIPQSQNGNAINNFLPTYDALRHTTIPALKIDQLIGSKQKISFYWSKTRTTAPLSPIYGNSEGLPSPITESRGSYIGGPVERLNYDYTVTPTMLVHIGVGYQQNDFFDDAPVLNYNAAASLGLTGATLNRNFPIFNGFCSPTIACTAAGGTYNMGPPGQGHSFWEKPSTNGSLTWVRGNHTVKGGTDMYWSAVPQIPYTNTNGAYTFSANETAMPYLVGQTLPGGSLGFPYASFLLGNVDTYNIAAVADYRNAKKQLGFFLQDSWKISRKLTVDYGVRYDYGTYYTEEHGRAVDFSATTTNPVTNTPGAFLFEGSGAGHCNCEFAKNYPYAFGPRLGAAYSLNDKTVIRAGWGVIYGPTSVNPLGVNAAGIVNDNQVGSPGQGLPAMTLSGGIPTNTIPSWPTFSAGVAPISPIGNQPLPAGVVLLDPNAGRPPRQNQWSIGIQHEVTSNLAVEASYVGNRGVWWQAPSLNDVNAITPSILAAHNMNLSNPAIPTLLSTPLGSVPAATLAQYNLGIPYVGFSPNQTVAQSLRPFPQFANIPVSGNPQGKTWYDSLQTKLTLRPTHGMVLTSTFSWQKSMDVGVDNNPAGLGPTVPNGTGTPTVYVNNTYLGAQQSKAISEFDQPFLFVVAGSYTIPKIDRLKRASWFVKDWQIGTLLSYSSGLPIAAPASTSSIASQLFQGSLDDRVPGVPLYLVPSLNCHCFDPATTPVLNPAAWVAPPAGQFGTAAAFYSDYRYPRHPAENINLGRTWRFKERMSLNLRVEFSNFFNRTYLNNVTASNPTTPVTRNGSGLLTGGFGYISTAFSSTTQLAQPRNGVIVARFIF